MAELHKVEFSEGEYEVRLEELSFWMNLPVTREFRRRLIERFDHQMMILSSQPGSSVDRLIGRAEVLQVIRDPRQLFED